jgi:uncharacterized protein YecT (DUF1311 family)
MAARMNHSRPRLLYAVLLIFAAPAVMAQNDHIDCASITSDQGIVLTSHTGWGDRISTKCSFRPPVEITVIAKTDSTNLRLVYAADQIIFNWELDRTQLRVDGGPANGKHKGGAGGIPVNQYVTVRWVVTASKQSVYVDNQLRYEDAGDYSSIYRPVSVFAAEGSVLTVKSVVVRKLPLIEVEQGEIVHCEVATNRELIRNCLVKALRDSDEALNAAYQERMQQLADNDQQALRIQQRAWLRTRDGSCEIQGVPTDHEQWLEWLEKHEDRMICVTHYGLVRATELRETNFEAATQTVGPAIQSAIYKSPRNGQSFDVTNQLRSLCGRDQKSCAIDCGNQLAGDPDFGQVKFCRISYACGDGRVRDLQIQEGEKAQLSCPAQNRDVP